MWATPLPTPHDERGRPQRASELHARPYFHQELAALRKLEKTVWPDGPVCPHCGATDRIGAVTGKGARLGLKFCCRCRKQFRVTIGTLFEGSHVPLHKWFQTCLLLTAAGVGISAHQLHRHLGVTYKTALWMVRRLEPAVAAAMAEMHPGAAGANRRDEALAGGRRRVRWQRRRHPASLLTAHGVTPEDEDMVPWAYPAVAPEAAFRDFAEIARGLDCVEEERDFDAVLRRVSAPPAACRPAAGKLTQ
jgi:transposase-like protein